MRHMLMARGAGRVMDVCVGLKPGESVLIIVEPDTARMGEVLAGAALERGAEPVVAVIAPRRLQGQEPPESVRAAMLKADVVLTPLVVAIDHAAAVREAAAAGARVLAMGGISEEQLMAGGIDADFHAIAPICRKLADRMTQCSEARLTTEAGTDLTMDLRGRKAIALVPLLTGPGQVVGFSTIEATINPVAGASHGTIVVDASILLAGFRPLGPGESFTMKIENGKVTSIEGSGEAARLRRLLDGETDAHIRDVAQLAIGLNPLARLVPELSEAEGILGTAHIGIGSGAFLGGGFQAPMHFDVLMWNATLFLDGQIAFRDGTTVD